MLTIPQLTRQLSRLKTFMQPSAKEEQYSTPPEIAAEGIHYAAELHDISNKKVTDLGAGTGILGICALLLGARECTFVERDSAALHILRENVRLLPPELCDHVRIIQADVHDFNEKSEIIIMNPPFGTKQVHADKPFFERAMTLAPTIYAFAKSTTHRFIEKITADHEFAITHAWRFDNWRLPATQPWHRKRTATIDVTLYRALYHPTSGSKVTRQTTGEAPNIREK